MYDVKPVQRNRTVSVIIDTGNQEKSVFLRGDDVGYSATLTPDMRAQAHLRYVVCRPVKGQPVGISAGDVVSSSFTVEPIDDKQELEVSPPKGEDPTLVADEDYPESEPQHYSEEELSRMKKSQLVAIVELNPELGIETNQNKGDILSDLLGYDIPKE